MCAQSKAQHDSPLGVSPPVRPRMPWRVVAVKALPGFRLHVRFVDGTEGTVDLTAMIQSPDAGVFSALTEPSLFSGAHRMRRSDVAG